MTPLQAQTSASGVAAVTGGSPSTIEPTSSPPRVDVAPVVAGARVERDDLVLALELAHA